MVSAGNWREVFCSFQAQVRGPVFGRLEGEACCCQAAVHVRNEGRSRSPRRHQAAVHVRIEAGPMKAAQSLALGLPRDLMGSYLSVVGECILYRTVTDSGSIGGP